MFKSAASSRNSGGIGFLLSPSASDALLEIHFATNRLGIASFSLKDRRLHVICVYAPTSPRTQEDPAETETLYERLGSLVDSLPTRDCVFIAGDFNAPLSADGRTVKNSCGRPNLNSNFLSTFIQARDLTAINGFLRQRHKKLPTFYGPNRRVTRLDWILCPSSLNTRLRRVFNIRPVCIPSDHSLLACETDLRWPRRKLPQPTPQWSALASQETREVFLKKLRAANPGVGDSADSLSKAILTAASALPKKRCDQPKTLWLNDPVIDQARRRAQSASALHGANSHQAKEAVTKLKEVHAVRSERYIADEVSNIQQATDKSRHSEAWRAINRLTGRRARPRTIIGAMSVEHRKALLVSHYSRVLNTPAPPTAPLPIEEFQPADPNAFNTGPITVEEIQRALRTMRADAATGADGISTWALKLPELAPFLASAFNKHCCLGGDSRSSAPPSWRISMIVPIPKNSGSTSLDNHRGIALESAVPKLLNAVLRNRLLPGLNPILLGIQSGFRPGRSAVEQIAALRLVIDACRTRQRAISIVFVDFQKAFDSVSRSSISWLLSAYGVPSALVQATMDLYSGSRAFVKTTDGPTREFNSSSGVLQGDPLSPLLFLLVADYVLRRCLKEEDSYLLAPRRSSRSPAVSLPALAYADDIALLCRDPASAQRALTRLCEEAARVGLQVNGRKTKVLHVGHTDAPTLLLPNGDPVTTCEDFTYLGSRIMRPDSIVAERRAQAWRAAYLLRAFFNSGANEALKIRLFRTAVEPIFSYGLEAVPLTTTRESALNASYRALLRFAVGIHFPQRISCRQLMAKTGVPIFSEILRRRRQMLLGHCLRCHGRGELNPLALTLLHPSVERLRRGQARTLTLTSTFLSDLRALDLTPQSASTCPSALFVQRVRARQN